MVELLNSSRLKAYRACPRQHYLSYVQGYRPRAVAPALEFGTGMHAALAAWWLAPRAEAFEHALAALPAGWDPYVRARAEAMLAGYDAFWSGEGFEAVAVEAPFRLPLLNPETGYPSRTWELGGTVDGIVRGPDGRVWVLEHKTTSEDASPGSAYRRRLAMDGQISQYIEGAQALGYDVAGVVYDVLVKPDLRPLKATPAEARKYTRAGALYAAQRDRDETPAEYGARIVDAIAEAPHRYFARVDVVRLESEREDWRWDVWQLAEQMRASARTGRAPKNPDACFRYGTPCAFWDVCSNVASIDDESRFVRGGSEGSL